MKKVLIITYYWPPSGGGGVQRVLKLVKYLRQFGWEPVVYTAANPERPVYDASLEKDIPPNIEVWKHRIWEPYEFYKKLTGKKKDDAMYSGFISESKKPKLSQKISVWIRGNFFIPDARCFWIKPSIYFLIKRLEKYPVDAMISTGPPHTTHLIAKGLKDELEIPWIADFRDPWTNIDFYSQLMLTKLADREHHRLERKVLRSADKVVTVSWRWAEDFKKLCGRDIEVITNGFDEEDFTTTNEIKREQGKFIVCHVGSMNKDRAVPIFWQAINELRNENNDFKLQLQIKLVGKNDVSVREQIKKNDLAVCTLFTDFLPHAEVAALQQSSSVLLLPLNDTPNVHGIIPGKLYEYLAAKRPVILIGDVHGDSARIVNETGAGVTCGFDEKEKMKTELLKMYQQFKERKLIVHSKGVEQYSRKRIAEKMAKLLDDVII